MEKEPLEKEYDEYKEQQDYFIELLESIKDNTESIKDSILIIIILFSSFFGGSIGFFIAWCMR